MSPPIGEWLETDCGQICAFHENNGQPLQHAGNQRDHKILGLPFCMQLLSLSENVGNWSGNTDFTLVTTDFRGAAG